MLFFGHIGLTIGTVKVCQELIVRNKKSNAGKLLEKIKTIDYRFVLLGSMLPDIIDKPVWLFTANSFQWAGRGYAHSFLFSFILLMAGVILLRQRGKSWLLVTSIGSFVHLVLDMMWLNPATLWWPLAGPVQRTVSSGFLFNLWNLLTSDPYTYISEILGLVVVLYIVTRIALSRKITYFIKYGDIIRGK